MGGDVMPPVVSVAESWCLDGFVLGGALTWVKLPVEDVEVCKGAAPGGLLFSGLAVSEGWLGVGKMFSPGNWEWLVD